MRVGLRVLSEFLIDAHATTLVAAVDTGFVKGSIVRAEAAFTAIPHRHGVGVR